MADNEQATPSIPAPHGKTTGERYDSAARSFFLAFEAEMANNPALLDSCTPYTRAAFEQAKTVHADWWAEVDAMLAADKARKASAAGFDSATAAIADHLPESAYQAHSAVEDVPPAPTHTHSVARVCNQCYQDFQPGATWCYACGSRSYTEIDLTQRASEAVKTVMFRNQAAKRAVLRYSPVDGQSLPIETEYNNPEKADGTADASPVDPMDIPF